MNYRHRANGTYPVTADQIRHAHRANVSFGPMLDADTAAALGYDAVVADATPAFNPQTQICTAADPQLIDGVWHQGWNVTTLTPAEIDDKSAAQKAAMVATFTDALTAHLDAVAQTRRYDNRITCALRAGYVGPFQAEGAAFAAWMDTCNALAYSLLAEVEAGTRPMPTNPQELIDALPTMAWPI